MIIDPYIASVLGLAVIFSFACIGLNIQLGFAGLLNLGIMVFDAIGAYSVAILTTEYGVPFIAAMLIGMMLAALAAYLIARISLGRRGDYFGMVTLGWGLIAYVILLNWRDLTRGALGIAGIPRPDLFGFTFNSFESYLLFCAVLLALVYFLLDRLLNSPFGRVLRAIRDDEDGSQALGKDTTRYKTIAFVLGAVVASMGGALYAGYSSYIQPGDFGFLNSVLAAFAVLLGGAGNLAGSVLGAFLYTLLPEPLRFLNLPPDLFGALRILLFGLGVLALIRWRGHGLLPEKAKHHL